MGAAAQPRASVRVLRLDRPPRSHGAVSGPSQSRSAAPFPGGPAAGAVPTGKFSRGAHACEPPLSSCNRWRQGCRPRARPRRRSAAEMLAARSDAPRRARRERDEAIRSVPRIAPYVKCSLWMAANCANRGARWRRERLRRRAKRPSAPGDSGRKMKRGAPRSGGRADRFALASGFVSAVAKASQQLALGFCRFEGDRAGELHGSALDDPVAGVSLADCQRLHFAASLDRGVCGRRVQLVNVAYASSS